jgi:hypothetical protein
MECLRYINSSNYPDFGYVYRLSDPRTGLVRYVGFCSNPRNTAARHRSLTANAKSQPALKAWIAELRALGLKPEFLVLQKVPYGLGHNIETAYIRSFHESVPGQLLNKVQLLSNDESGLRDRARRYRYYHSLIKPTVNARSRAGAPCVPELVAQTNLHH